MALYDDRKVKDEDEWITVISPFGGLEKGTVIQDCRIFNDNQLDTRKCEQLLVKLLYLVGQGESFTSAEATTIFFSVSKLFQSKEHSLRRLVYLAINELATISEDAFIVTNCLTKDINSDVDMYRAHATRVLCRITDAQMVQAIERYLKQEIVDKNTVVASSAIVAGQTLILSNKGDIVRRWVNEVSQALEHWSPMVQYHALCLLYMIRQNDRLAVTKMVQNLARSGLSSPMAVCMHIRCISRVMKENGPPRPGEPRVFYDYLENCLRHRSDIVIYEAARAIASLPEVTSTELAPVVNVLQLFLSQSKSVLRFAAMRVLNQIANIHPIAVSSCNTEMEILITDPNRTIATLAITALLRSGSEGSIERLLKQIQLFMADIGDEFKIKVVEAIDSLCTKFPSKQYTLFNFLGGALREEGGFEFKRCVVNTYLSLMDRIPDSKELCLSHLCEFIEDCEHTSLSTQILHLLGKEGPHTSDPGKYVRYIYNRLILENATVRSAAVSALARFASQNSDDKLRHSITLLLLQARLDNDDEVRDRAAYFIESLNLEKAAEAVDSEKTEALSHLGCPVGNLEAELLRYVSSNEYASGFTLSQVSKAAIPGVSDHQVEKYKSSKPGAAITPAAPKAKDLAEQVMAHPELKGFGRPFKSSEPVQLTEEETEYVVKCIKHVYKNCVVLEFHVVNTLNDIHLSNVYVNVDISEIEGVTEMKALPVNALPYGSPGICFSVLESSGDNFLLGTMSCTLKYSVHDVDPATHEPDEEGYEDEYQIDDLTIAVGDLVSPPAELPSSFKAAWDAMGSDHEVTDSFSLAQYNDVGSAVAAVIQFLGLSPCEGTDKINERSHSQTLLLAGIVVPSYQALVRAQLDVQAGEGVNLNVTIRSENSAVSELVASSIA